MNKMQGHHCLSAIEVVRTELKRNQNFWSGGHHCLSAIEVVRTEVEEGKKALFELSPLPVGN